MAGAAADVAVLAAAAAAGAEAALVAGAALAAASAAEGTYQLVPAGLDGLLSTATQEAAASRWGARGMVVSAIVRGLLRVQYGTVVLLEDALMSADLDPGWLLQCNCRILLYHCAMNFAAANTTVTRLLTVLVGADSEEEGASAARLPVLAAPLLAAARHLLVALALAAAAASAGVAARPFRLVAAAAVGILTGPPLGLLPMAAAAAAPAGLRLLRRTATARRPGRPSSGMAAAAAWGLRVAAKTGE